MAFFGLHKPICQNNVTFLNRLNSIFDHYLSTNQNIILIRNFNIYFKNTHLEAALENYDLSSLINKPNS